jgi:spore germination protein KA
MPKLFIEFFQSPEDYYTRSYYGSLLRLLRFIAFSLSVISPPAYVALTTFHQELIPTPLLVTLAAAREGTPFPAVFEALFMGLIFEVLREAGVRMPRQLGQAVSIVGALVIGEAAVSAGIIGAPMVIVIATTAISSFVVAGLHDVGIILRLILTVMAGVFGMFGVLIALLQVLIHLSSIRSFGTPFLSPVAPLSLRDQKDTFIRVPMWAMFTRPRLTGWIDPKRQEFSLIPEKPETD